MFLSTSLLPSVRRCGRYAHLNINARPVKPYYSFVQRGLLLTLYWFRGLVRGERRESTTPTPTSGPPEADTPLSAASGLWDVYVVRALTMRCTRGGGRN